MDYSDFPSEEREEILKGLREEYGIELSREEFDKLLKGKILELPPQLVKIERMVMKIQQLLLILEVEMKIGRTEVQIPLFLEFVTIGLRDPLSCRHLGGDSLS